MYLFIPDLKKTSRQDSYEEADASLKLEAPGNNGNQDNGIRGNLNSYMRLCMGSHALNAEISKYDFKSNFLDKLTKPLIFTAILDF